MKISLFLMLSACFTVYAETRVLPPVVDNSTYPAGAAGYGSASPSANAIYEVLGRLEQLQLELQQLRGVVEEQSQTIMNLKKRQGNIYSDLDLRLQELTGKKTAADAAKLVIPAATELMTEKTVSKQAVNKAGAAATVTDSKPAVISDKEQYKIAYELLRNGHNRQAIKKFKALLASFPKGEFADNSQYWLGEAYKVTQDLESAKKAFLKVVTDYAGSPKVADAFLKLGYIEFEQKNMAKARDYLTQVTVAHPDTTAAHLATKKLMQMRTMQF